MNNLPDNLTYEQFIELASREPDLSGNWVYQLEMTELGDAPRHYPVYKVGETKRFDFSSLAEAEKFMESEAKRTPMYRSRITQIPVGGTINERGAQWLYDGEGNLVDCTIVQKSGTPEQTHFFGRSFGDQRFGLGDPAELLQGDTIILGLVCFPQYPPSECWKWYMAKKSDYPFDYRKDSYPIIIDNEGGVDLALSTALMPPQLEITEDIAKMLDTYYINLLRNPERQNIIGVIPVYDDDDEIDAENEELSGENE